jgi:hypothetical protein
LKRKREKTYINLVGWSIKKCTTSYVKEYVFRSFVRIEYFKKCNKTSEKRVALVYRKYQRNDSESVYRKYQSNDSESVYRKYQSNVSITHVIMPKIFCWIKLFFSDLLFSYFYALPFFFKSKITKSYLVLII